MSKKLSLTYTVMLCVEFRQVQCIDLSYIVHVLKAVAIVTSKHLNLLTFLMVSHFCGIILVVERVSYVTHTCASFSFFNFSTKMSL